MVVLHIKARMAINISKDPCLAWLFSYTCRALNRSNMEQDTTTAVRLRSEWWLESNLGLLAFTLTCPSLVRAVKVAAGPNPADPQLAVVSVSYTHSATTAAATRGQWLRWI